MKTFQVILPLNNRRFLFLILFTWSAIWVTKEALAMTLIEAIISLVADLWPSLFASDRGRK